jgi:hypothetical protein
MNNTSVQYHCNLLPPELDPKPLLCPNPLDDVPNPVEEVPNPLVAVLQHFLTCLIFYWLISIITRDAI